MPMLEVKGLKVGFGGAMTILNGLDLTMERGETVALVGESGSGKSMTALSIMRLLPRGTSVTGGRILFEDQDVLAMPTGRMNRLRGGEIALLFQHPLVMLDPSATVGSQVAEAVTLHSNRRGAAAWDRVIELFREVGIPAPEARARSYAHQLSGGMAQRVMIACALAGDPHLLIADEPTTALDVTVQLQILKLLAQQRAARRLSTLLITHDLGVVSALADRILVLYAGRVVEQGTGRDILERPQHPYTQALVRASLLKTEANGTLFAIKGMLAHEALSQTGCSFLPRCITAEKLGVQATCAGREPPLAVTGPAGSEHRARCHAPGPPVPEEDTPAAAARVVRPPRPPAVTMSGVSKHYGQGSGMTIRSLDRVDLEIREGEVLGLVGESGCGKSTLAKVLLHMTASTAGSIHILGHDYARMSAPGVRQLYRDVQLVFQDPFSALDPKMTLGRSLSAPLIHAASRTSAQRRVTVLDMMRQVGLTEAFYDRLPRECSGGQLQRAVIARALLMGPRILVCDEPTSALDASIRAQILNLLHQLHANRDLTMLMISHDLRVVRHLCDRVAVMYLGEVVELAETEDLFVRPVHPYTQALVAASLLDEHGLNCAMGQVQGEPPSPLSPPPGCRFHTRCHLADERCHAEHPVLHEVLPGHSSRCWQWDTALMAGQMSHPANPTASPMLV